MKATHILTKLLTDVTPNMHAKRRQALYALTHSLLSGAALTVTSLGRHIKSQTTDKHQIKRSTRLCSNPHLHHEIQPIYSLITQKVIATQSRPIILVDWSDLDPRKQHFLLRAAIAVQGRSCTLLEKIATLAEKEKPALHQQFMLTLKSLLPADCRPIIITDAGFRGPWFKLIESLGWDYVGRVRNRTYCQPNTQSEWFPAKSLYTQASTKPKSLGGYQLCRYAPQSCQLVVYQGNKKGRKDYTANGQAIRRAKHSRANANREKEPWLLACSDETLTAKRIVKLYQTRMQIEESFRDLKSGLNFNKSNTRQRKRLMVLLLISLLAQYALYLLGFISTLNQQHRRYQANSTKTRRVLSVQFIGLRAFQDKEFNFSLAQYLSAWTKIPLIAWENIL